MRSVIFKWNPAFSSYPMIGYLDALYGLINNRDVHFNWSVWDHEKIHEGDRYYWLKLGYGQAGICSCGTIVSEPYEGEDWSGKGRKTYYVDFRPEVMINPDTLPILTASALSTAIPDFEWDGGHSGVVLTAQQSECLENLWQEFIARHQGYWEKALNARCKDQLWMNRIEGGYFA